MTAGSEEIVVSHLTKLYKSLRAVDDLSFTVHSGRVTGFLGPNGAGKTTTLRMLLGLVTPSAGTATFGGVRYNDLDQPIRHVGAVLEASSAHKGRTGLNHLRMICTAAGLPWQAADEALAKVGLTPAAKRKFKGYSLGMKQRLGIAAALLGNPRVLILDEPANGLDPEGVRWLRDLLRAFAAQGRTVLVSSHHLAEVAQTVDQVVIINRGRFVVESALSALTARLGATIRVETTQPDALDGALRHAGVSGTDRENGTLHVHGATADQIDEIARNANVPLRELVTERSSLEDVFLELTAEESS